MKQSILSLLAIMTFSSMGAPSKAAMIVEFSETDGNVRLDYYGSLDLSGIPIIQGLSTNYSIANNSPEHSVRYVFESFGGDDYTAIINLPGGNVRVYHSPFASGPGLYLTALASTPEADVSGGSAIILPTLSTEPNATLRLGPADFTSNDPNLWTGSGYMQWNNKTLAQLNIDASPKTWVLKGSFDTIQLRTAPVPEPSGLVLCAVGMGALAMARRCRFQKR